MVQKEIQLAFLVEENEDKKKKKEILGCSTLLFQLLQVDTNRQSKKIKIKIKIQ